MSLVLFGLQAATAAFRTSFINRAVSARFVSRSTPFFNEENAENAEQGNIDDIPIDPAKDRRNPVPVETSIRYVVSDAFKETYGNNPVWKLYRRNHKGMYPPKKTRRTCIRSGIISTGNPCPICRDEYLILDHRNTVLLNQFISEFNGEVLSYKKTGICQKQHKNLLIAIHRAKDYGTIAFDVPFREYDYSDWYKGETETTAKSSNTKQNAKKKTMAEFPNEIPFVIIGGGIAGVSCVESLAFLAPETEVVLITASPLVKAVTNIVPLATTLTQFDVEEREASALTVSNPSVTVLEDVVISVNLAKKSIETRKGSLIKYNKLCICTGAKPRLIYQNNERVIGIRDTESVENLSLKIEKARRIIVVGNGGIATELVHQVEGVEVIWVIRDKHISATFVDPGAAEFFQDKLLNRNAKSSDSEKKKVKEVKRIKYTITEGAESKEGPALGPDWHSTFAMKGASTSSSLSDRVTVEYQSEISNILEPSILTDTEKSSVDDWPIYAKLTNGKIIGCDIIISATGVEPNSKIFGLENLKKAEDGGFSVDWRMETSEKDVYAAGDVCSACWDVAEHWFQMRLWTQAHQMGRYAAKAMFSALNNEEFHQDFCFDLFTHVTNFFGFKVVLLGLYNGQKLGRDYEILLRMTKGLEYVKLVLRNGRMQGAVLIGETDLEEMCENLILNQLDLSIYGNDLLDPNIDIEDYFD